MKKLSLVLIITLLAFACVEKQGPVGPEGPRGTRTIILSGVIANGHYDGSFCRIYSPDIYDEDVVQVYISEDHTPWYWTFVYDFRLSHGRVSIYDPERDYLGYNYKIKIIKEE